MSQIIHLASISGGKDSLATWLMAIETMGRENVRAITADTGNEHDETYRYIDYLERAVGMEIIRLKANFDADIARKRQYVIDKWPDKGVPADVVARAAKILEKPTGNPYLDLCLWKGRFPSRKAQFCTQFLKTEPLTEYALGLIDAGNAVWSWQGVRIDESGSRRARLQGSGACVKAFEEVGGGLFINRPILRWTAADTFDAARLFGIEPNPLYKLGMGRVGCMPCINANKNEISEIARRFPEHIARIAEWERLVSVASKRSASTFFHKGWGEAPGLDVSSAQIFSVGNIYEVVRWSKTTRGGRQIDMIKAAEDTPECSSSYGLCDR